MVIGLPLCALAVRAACRQGRRANLRIPARLALFFLVSLALTRLSPIWPFRKQLWQAMTLEALWALAFLLITRTGSQAGLTLRLSRQAWRDSAIVTVLLLILVVARQLAVRSLGVGAPAETSVNLEFLIYQLTMPGLAEELSYRGVIQPELNRLLGRPWKLLGAQVGWGWVIASLIFWAPHAFRVDGSLHLTFYWPTLTMQLIAGFVLGWLRERSGSLLPPMLAHNLVNVVWTLA